MQKFQRYLSIQKVDEEQQMVYGYASTPDLDSDGEIVSLKAIADALPEYLKFPTIREMHQPVAAGRTKTAQVQKDKGLWIGAKIIAKDAWEKVKEGVYSGFSIGGNVIEKIDNVITALELVEISLVDVPANKAAKIELWKGRRGGQRKIRKDASDAASLAGMIEYLEYMVSRELAEGDSKTVNAIKAAIQPLKDAVVSEITESDDGGEMFPEDMIMMAALLNERSETVKKLDLGNEKGANLIREGVITAMTKVAEKLQEQAADEEVKSSEATADEAAAEDESKEVEASEEAEVETAEETAPEGDEAAAEGDEGGKEASDKADTLSKISKMDKALDGLSKVKKEETLKSQSLSKSVDALVSSFGKMVTVISELEERLGKVEKTPAAPKSRASQVFKSDADKEEKTGDEGTSDSSELKAKKARLVELNKIYDQIGKAEFAKAGHSMEASKLYGEIEVLERKAQG